MARYIDAEKLEEGIFPEVTNWYQEGWNDALKGAMLAIPTADVVERSEVEELKKAYAIYEEITGLKQAKQEVARELFEEIEKSCFDFGTIPNGCGVVSAYMIAELKKRYTEEKT